MWVDWVDDYIVVRLASVSRPKEEPICHRRIRLIDEPKNSRGFDITSCEVYSDLRGASPPGSLMVPPQKYNS